MAVARTARPCSRYPISLRPAGEGRRHDDIGPGHERYRYARAARGAPAARRRSQRHRPQPPPGKPPKASATPPVTSAPARAPTPPCEAPRSSCTPQAAARPTSRRPARWSARPGTRGTSWSSPSSARTAPRRSPPRPGVVRLVRHEARHRAGRRASGLGWTPLCPTQLHDLILARALAQLPVIPVPAGSRFQPAGATDVVQRMAELALGEPSGLVPDLAGRKSTLRPCWLKLLSAAGKRLAPVHIPGQAAKAILTGANLPPIAPSASGRGREFLAGPHPAHQLATAMKRQTGISVSHGDLRLR